MLDGMNDSAMNGLVHTIPAAQSYEIVDNKKLAFQHILKLASYIKQ